MILSPRVGETLVSVQGIKHYFGFTIMTTIRAAPRHLCVSLEGTSLESLATHNCIPGPLRWKRNRGFSFFVYRTVTAGKTTRRKSQGNPHQRRRASLWWPCRGFQVFGWAIPHPGESLTGPSKVSFCLYSLQTKILTFTSQGQIQSWQMTQEGWGEAWEPRMSRNGGRGHPSI